MQVLPTIVPYIRTTSNIAISCRALRVWLSNNGFAIKSSKGDLCPETYDFYKLLDYPDLDEWTISEFYNALRTDNRDHLLSLLQAGANIDAKDSHGNTALIKAVWKGKTERLKLLLEHGVDLEVRNNKGETALIWTIWRGDVECLEILLQRGAKVAPWMRKKYPQYSELWGDSTL